MKYIFAILLFPQVLLAMTIFEPNIGVSSGTFSKKFTTGSVPSGSSVEGSFTTVNLGARYGITRKYIQVTAVADAYFLNSETNVGEFNSTLSNSSSEFDFSFGIGIGYEWNIPIRTYVIIGIPNSALEVSYFFSETLLIGLRYSQMKSPIAGVDVAYNTYGLSVSIPFEFKYPSYWWRKKDWD